MEPDEAFLAWLDISRTYAGVARRLERRLRPLGLTLAFCEVLTRLGQAPEGRLRVIDLGEKVFLTKSGISQLVTRMERAGLLTRTPDAADHRVTWITPSDRGWEALAAAAPVFVDGVHDHFGRHLEPQQTTVIRAALAAVIAGLGELPEPSTPPRLPPAPAPSVHGGADP